MSAHSEGLQPKSNRELSAQFLGYALEMQAWLDGPDGLNAPWFVSRAVRLEIKDARDSSEFFGHLES